MSLYEAAKRRRSIRNYADKRLSESILDDVESNLRETKKFKNGVSVDARLAKEGRSLQKDISGIIADYGKVEAPHYLVLISEDTNEGYLELGYRYEFVVLDLAARDIGTCWIGKGFRDKELSKHVNLPSDQTCITLIGLGSLPDGEKLNEIEDPKRKKLSHFLVNRDPKSLDKRTSGIIDCLRRSPSSLNSQPWRVVAEEGTLHLYLKTRSKITKMVVNNMDRMNWVDGGIGLCHLEIGGSYFWGQVDIDEIAHPEQRGLTYIGSLLKGG